MDILIGLIIWAIIFALWYVKNYPEKMRGILPAHLLNFRLPRRRRPGRRSEAKSSRSRHEFSELVRTVESIAAMDRMTASDAATMVEAVKGLMDIEPASGQIWEALALETLETAEITCDDCRVEVDKTVKRTGVKLQCGKCNKWLALKNSKVTVLDPNRPDLEDWERWKQ